MKRRCRQSRNSAHRSDRHPHARLRIGDRFAYWTLTFPDRSRPAPGRLDLLAGSKMASCVLELSWSADCCSSALATALSSPRCRCRSPPTAVGSASLPHSLLPPWRSIANLARLPLLGRFIPLGVDVLLRDLFLALLLLVADLRPSGSLPVGVLLIHRLIKIGSRLGSESASMPSTPAASEPALSPSHIPRRHRHQPRPLLVLVILVDVLLALILDLKLAIDQQRSRQQRPYHLGKLLFDWSADCSRSAAATASDSASMPVSPALNAPVRLTST